MGVAVPQTILQKRDYALQSDDYLRAPEISATLIHPHDIVRKINERQHELAKRLSRLSSWLLPEKAYEENLPSPVQESLQPFGKFNSIQEQIWEIISHLQEAYQQGEKYTGEPFTLEEIRKEIPTLQDEEIGLTLEILEAMGIIVPVNIKNPDNNQRMNFYRLVQANDVWHKATEENLEDGGT